MGQRVLMIVVMSTVITFCKQQTATNKPNMEGAQSKAKFPKGDKAHPSILSEWLE
jgi:hypothetical protein